MTRILSLAFATALAFASLLGAAPQATTLTTPTAQQTQLLPANPSDRTGAPSATVQAATPPAAVAAPSPLQSLPPATSETASYTLSVVPRETPHVLVVPAPEMPIDALGDLTKDLQIMGRLIDRLLERASVRALTWNPRVGRGPGTAKTVYLPGFGVLFVVQVDFPLTAPAQQPPETKEEPTDQLWAEARESLRAPSGLRRVRELPDPAYDELKVESLRRTLIQALKHASNIRHLTGAEQIIILAIGNVSGRTSPTWPTSGTAFPGGAYYDEGLLAADVSPTDIVSFHTTKKDADAIANGQIDAATFKERVKIITYALPLPASARGAQPSQTRIAR
jgi:hypothetical protein